MTPEEKEKQKEHEVLMAENKASTQMIQLEKTSIPKKNMTVAAFVVYFVVVTTSEGKR